MINKPLVLQCKEDCTKTQIPGTKKEALRPLLCDPSDALRIEFGAGNETRTRDPDLGKVVLYQLSYSRVVMGAILPIYKTASTP